MKKSLLILLIVWCNPLITSAQWINSMHIVPPNPVVGDAISVVAEVSFQSGTCDQKMTNFQIAGNDVMASALHCIGPLTYICDDTDSFYVGLLPAGNYNFIFHVDAGMAPSPCTPGIVAGPTDTLPFTVSAVTTMDELTLQNNFLYLMSDNHLFIKTILDSYTVYIYNSAGQKIYSNTGKGDTEIDLHQLAKGIYTAITFDDSRLNDYRFLIH